MPGARHVTCRHGLLPRRPLALSCQGSCRLLAGAALPSVPPPRPPLRARGALGSGGAAPCVGVQAALRYAQHEAGAAAPERAPSRIVLHAAHAQRSRRLSAPRACGTDVAPSGTAFRSAVQSARQRLASKARSDRLPLSAPALARRRPPSLPARRPRPTASLPPCRSRESPCSLAGRQLGCAAAKDQPCSPYPTS